MTEKSKHRWLIGLGIMGHAMSKNLLEAGFSFVGYDIAKRAVSRFADMGGKVAGSVREVAAGADILILRRPSSSIRLQARLRPHATQAHSACKH